MHRKVLLRIGSRMDDVPRVDQTADFTNIKNRINNTKTRLQTSLKAMEMEYLQVVVNADAAVLVGRVAENAALMGAELAAAQPEAEYISTADANVIMEIEMLIRSKLFKHFSS